MIDFHCHLDLYPEPADIIRECSRRRMYVLSMTTTPSAWSMSSALAAGCDRIRTALGLHPQLAAERKSELSEFDRLLPETRYVGEVGLDGSPECSPFWRDQVEVFEHVLASCSAGGGRIISIHSRRAEGEVLSHLESYRQAGTMVLHWFSGSRQSLERAVGLGCWFSVGPSMLRTKKGRGLVESMPADRVLTESDGPFAKHDGCPVVPWDVQDAVLRLASMWRLSPGEAEERLLLNLRALLGSIRDGQT